MNQQKQNGNIIAIITMFFLFAMISFVTNLAAPFGTIWKNQYAGANTLGMMGNMMNFLAYLFMGIPSGNMLVKIGYKKTALIAMAVGFIGLFIQYISSLFGADIDVFNLGEYAIKMNFIIYLLGAFVCGFCVCMLNTVVNPMLNLLGGGGNKGNQLIRWCSKLIVRYFDSAFRRCLDWFCYPSNSYVRCSSSAFHRNGCIRISVYRSFIHRHSRASSKKSRS
jgi:FHS family L-fucose permease-like MFS transporter